KVLVGNASNVYVSRSNIYLATTRYEYPNQPEPEPQPPFPIPFFGVREQSMDSRQQDFIAPYEPPQIFTDAFKLGMNGTSVEFKAQGSVPGTILNQFSMDEFDGNFRIATNTNMTGNWNEGMTNNVYVLD